MSSTVVDDLRRDSGCAAEDVLSGLAVVIVPTVWSTVAGVLSLSAQLASGRRRLRDRAGPRSPQR
jgi:hypothetical protein